MDPPPRAVASWVRRGASPVSNTHATSKGSIAYNRYYVPIITTTYDYRLSLILVYRYCFYG